VCVSVCLSLAACPHYCTDLDVTWVNGTGCPLVLHYCADFQSVHGFRCYDNTAPNAKCQRVLVLALCLVSCPADEQTWQAWIGNQWNSMAAFMTWSLGRRPYTSHIAALMMQQDFRDGCPPCQPTTSIKAWTTYHYHRCMAIIQDNLH